MQRKTQEISVLEKPACLHFGINWTCDLRKNQSKNSQKTNKRRKIKITSSHNCLTARENTGSWLVKNDITHAWIKMISSLASQRSWRDILSQNYLNNRENRATTSFFFGRDWQPVALVPRIGVPDWILHISSMTRTALSKLFYILTRYSRILISYQRTDARLTFNISF